MSDLLMLDSIEVSQFKGLKFDALAGYVPPSSWPDYQLECIDYPALAKIHRIESITPSAFDDASIIDCENGDATPPEVPAWVDRQLARGVWRPGVYASLSAWDGGLLPALAHYDAKIRRWVADWTFSFAFSVSWADAQQYTDRYAGRNIDGSICKDTFFPAVAQPTPKNDLHYDWFDTHKRVTPYGRVSESDAAKAYDEKRDKFGAKLTIKQHAELARMEAECHWFMGRTASIARHLHPLPDGHANWRPDHLGYRHVALARRSQGQRMV